MPASARVWHAHLDLEQAMKPRLILIPAILILIVAPVGIAPSLHALESPETKPITESQRLRITMLDTVFRFDGQQVDSIDAVLQRVKVNKPASIIVSVCAVTREQRVARLQAGLMDVHAGYLEIRRLPWKAVECSWSNALPPPRSS